MEIRTRVRLLRSVGVVPSELAPLPRVGRPRVRLGVRQPDDSTLLGPNDPRYAFLSTPLRSDYPPARDGEPSLW